MSALGLLNTTTKPERAVRSRCRYRSGRRERRRQNEALSRSASDPGGGCDPGVEHLDDFDHAAWPPPSRSRRTSRACSFFNPGSIACRLVEVIRGEKTSDQTVVTLVALAKKVGKTPIVVKDCPGFLVNRILFPYLNEAMILLEEGAEPRALDKAASDFGMPMGPITLSDVVGLDTCLYAGMVVNRAFKDRAKDTKILAALVAAKRLGQKSGAGFYSYAKGSRGVDDPAFALTILDICRNRQALRSAPKNCAIVCSCQC